MTTLLPQRRSFLVHHYFRDNVALFATFEGRCRLIEDLEAYQAGLKMPMTRLRPWSSQRCDDTTLHQRGWQRLWPNGRIKFLNPTEGLFSRLLRSDPQNLLNQLKKMHQPYKYKIAQCDVSEESRTALEAFRGKRLFWQSWIDDDEHHAIWQVLHGMVWQDVVFRSLTSLAVEDNASALHNSLLAETLLSG